MKTQLIIALILTSLLSSCVVPPPRRNMGPPPMPMVHQQQMMMNPGLRPGPGMQQHPGMPHAGAGRGQRINHGVQGRFVQKWTNGQKDGPPIWIPADEDSDPQGKTYNGLEVKHRAGTQIEKAELDRILNQIIGGPEEA